MNGTLIDLGGYGPVMTHGQLCAELRGKGKEPMVRALLQVLALAREQAHVDTGAAATRGDAAVTGAAGKAEGLRLALADVHRLLNGQPVDWLRDLLGGE